MDALLRRNRRRLLIGGGAASLALGAWLATARRDAEPADVAPTAGSAPLGVDDLWTLDLPTPEGRRLRMADFRAGGLVLNFWATWCAPCLREFPELDRFAREVRASGWRVVGLAIDDAAAVRRYLEKLPVSFEIGVAGVDGLVWSKLLGNATGGLPFTAAFEPGGRLLHTIIGETNANVLRSIMNGGTRAN